VAPDAALAIADLRAQGSDAILLFDGQKIVPTFNATASWTGVNNPANFLPFPADVIRKYVARGAKKFRRDGWLVMTEIDIDLWLPVFEQSYTVTERRKYGGYTAFHLAPRDVR
jgi:hypothetical protein